MIFIDGDIVRITCDKCGRFSLSPFCCANYIFNNEQWILFHGKKYTHLCIECSTPHIREHDFLFEFLS